MAHEDARLVAGGSPVENAWAEFDAAALNLRSTYDIAARVDTPARRASRMDQAMNVTRLWKRFQDLYLTMCDADPGEDA